ncbi:carboxypeptidase-like regulatory domain-containing protein [Chryseobacterium sp. MMS23-Vi53]|uniref:carboxypeptidase-like regulatory domain-containing protein n=1 Tax=Chryseobacterium sp. MMS23-Vi53 TaxID=3386644 RepID=UPI0039EC29D4
MRLKLFFLFSLIFFINIHAQDYIFGKITTEENTEMPDVTVINIRTDERATTNRDGHFMISGRAGDELRFVKTGYERTNRKVTKENITSPINVTLTRSAALIAEVEIKKDITGDLKIDSKNLNPPRKVQKLKSDLAVYMSQKSDPRILAARAGEFVQPKGQGFSVGKVKNKWDDVDFMNYLTYALGEKYFTDLQIDKSLIQNFIYYVFAGGFERKNILKYGFCSDADLMRFQRMVLTRISSYRAPQTQK